MEREFTYTKDKLRFILAHLLEHDVGDPRYLEVERAEEGFEKRAVLEFLMWFIGEAYPEGFTFANRYAELEREYPAATAHAIASGTGWAARHVRDDEGDNVVYVDFRQR